MRFLTISALAIIGQSAVAQTAPAEDLALIVGTQRYETLDRVSSGTDVVEAARALEDVGFTLVTAADADLAEIYDAAGRFAAQRDGADRLVVVLSGRFVTDGDRTWYLPRGSDTPSLMTVDRTALSVETLMQVLSSAPGAAVLVLGSDADGERYDAWLRDGIGALDVPQGVLVVRGAPDDVADFVEDALASPQGDLSALIGADRDIRATGYRPAPFVFTGPERTATAPVTQPADDATERALWEGAVALDTPEAFANYLDRYPRGRFADRATARREEILAEPNRTARLAEEAMQLSRDDRRDIQRSLSLLDFNTRGIDGIFGPGTRGAITNWQQQNGFAQTSYITAEQAARLEAQAARRAAEIEAEAERQRQQQVIADRAYWDETGARGDEPGLRAYLDRYPDGLFSEAAHTRLDAIMAQQRQVAEAQDAAAWDRARGADSVAAYQDYLRTFPQGGFASAAEARIAELSVAQEQAPQLEAAQAAEQALGLNALTNQLVEQRLAARGLEPGPVDGQFDDNTRRAIRNYQRDRGIGDSGFLDEQTIILLLADALR